MYYSDGFAMRRYVEAGGHYTHTLATIAVPEWSKELDDPSVSADKPQK